MKFRYYQNIYLSKSYEQFFFSFRIFSISNWVSHIYEHVPSLHATVPEVLCVHVLTIYIYRKDSIKCPPSNKHPPLLKISGYIGQK